jgi:hypothetical protein
MWYVWLARRANGRGRIAFTFKDISKETGIPEQTIRKWHKSATLQGLFRSARTEDRKQIIYLHSMDIVLRGLLYQRRNCAFIEVSDDLKELRRDRKKFLYQATAFHRQRASMYAAGKAKVEAKLWESTCSSFLLHGARQGQHRVWFKANQPIAGATQKSMACLLMVNERTIRRNLKAVRSLRIYQEVVKGDMSECKRRGCLLDKGSVLWRTRPNFYLHEDLFEITPNFRIVSGRSVLRRWKKREAAC